MAAREFAGVLLVTDDLLPRLGGEGVQIECQRPQGAIFAGNREGFGDVFAGAFAAGTNEVHGIHHAGIGAGRFQGQGLQQLEQGRAVSPAERFQQRQIVASVVGRDRFVRGCQPLQAAGGLKRFQEFLPRLGCVEPFLGVPFVPGRLMGQGEDLSEDIEQVLRLGAVGELEFLEPLASLFVDEGHALAEHLDGLVAQADAGLMEEARDQGQPLGLPGPGKFIDIDGAGLPGEMGDPLRRDAAEPGAGLADRVEPAQELDAVLEFPQLHRRARGRLERLELAAPRYRVHQQQSFQPQPVTGSHPLLNPGEQRGVVPGTDPGDHAVESRIPGQLEAGTEQFFQRHVDQVGRVVLGHHRGLQRLGSHLANSFGIVDDAHADAHIIAIAPPCPLCPGRAGKVDRHTQQRSNMAGDGRGNLVGPREIPQPLIALQHRQQHRTTGFVPCLFPGPVLLVLGRGERLCQLPLRYRSGESRVGGPVHGRHESSSPAGNRRHRRGAQAETTSDNNEYLK